MFSTVEVVLCATAAVVLWTLPGVAIARRVAPSIAWSIAPSLGFAAHSAAMLPLFFLIGFSRSTVAAVAVLTLIVSVAGLATKRSTEGHGPIGVPAIGVPAFAVLMAALLSVAPALAILPKTASDGVILAGPIFDHAKVALIDEMTRLGLPPINPVFGEPSRLAYYYLWHFGAAELALPLRATGWEADAAMTWFAAFASLMLMMGLTIWFSGRAAAAYLVLPLCVAASLRPFLLWVFGAGLYQYILPPTGFAGWLFQAAWVPQHLMSATCIVLAVFLIGQLAFRPNPILPVTLALLVGAGFESSAWIGGVTFALAAPTVGVVLLISARRRLHFLLGSAIAAALALALVFPLAHDQYAATALRGPTLALEPIGVFEDFISEQVSAIIDLPGYWLIMLLIEFPAIYLPGAVALAQIVRSRLPTPETKGAARAFAALIVVSFSVAWLIASTIGENDDLGWRAILPGVMGLTIFAAVGLSRWLVLGVRFATIIAFGALLLGLPDGALLIYHFAIGSPKPSRAVFAATPAMWEAVRRHSAPTDRIANNPLFLHDMTNWPVNISWALLANRNSCYAGKELALAFASLSDEQREAIDAQFVRVFAGSGSIDDVQELATRYNCRLVVLTAEDGAWNNDPFSANSRYHLVEAASDKWRIYAVANQALSGTETK